MAALGFSSSFPGQNYGLKPALGQAGGSATGGGATSQVQTNSQTQTKEAAKSTSKEIFGSNKQSFGTESEQINVDMMDPATRQAYNQLITQLQGGGNSVLQQQQQAFLQTIQALQGNLEQFSPEAATAMAQGNVQGLTRQLMEQIMPQITGAQEAAGLSGDALTALLSQDAASRTAEAQQRAILEAVMGFGGLNNQAAGTLIEGTSKLDPVTSALLQTLNIGKGSVQQGYINTQSAMNESTQGFSNKVDEALRSVMQNQQGTQFGSQTGDASNDKLLKLAAAQSILPAGLSISDLGNYNPATFNTAGRQDSRLAQIQNALQMVGLA